MIVKLMMIVIFKIVLLVNMYNKYNIIQTKFDTDITLMSGSIIGSHCHLATSCSLYDLRISMLYKYYIQPTKY